MEIKILQMQPHKIEGCDRLCTFCLISTLYRKTHIKSYISELVILFRDYGSRNHYKMPAPECLSPLKIMIWGFTGYFLSKN